MKEKNKVIGQIPVKKNMYKENIEVIERSRNPGFKQTEVGLIPEDWEVKIITDLTKEIFLGLTSKVDYVSFGGFPLIRASDIAKGKLDLSRVRYISSNQHKSLTKYRRAKKGDLLVSKSGSLGVCALVDSDIEFSIYESIIVMQVLKEKLSVEFLLWLLRYEKTQVRILGEKVGSSVAHLNIEMFRKLYVPSPTLAEQKAIATALSDVDKLISRLDALIAKKKAIKQGAMQQLLTPPASATLSSRGDENKKEFEHGGIADTERSRSERNRRLDGFDGEWAEKRIGNIGSTYGGLTGKSKIDFQDGTFPYITFLNVMNNTVIDSTIFEYVHIKSGEQQNKARKGDLFFNTSSETPEEVGMCAYLNEEIENLFLNSFCFGFRLREDCEIDGLFFSYLMNSDIGRNLFLSLAQGATRYNLSKSNFNKLDVLVPSLAEQKAIAQILSDMDQELEALATKKEKYEHIKHGMMQELLTGKTRLV